MLKPTSEVHGDPVEAALAQEFASYLRQLSTSFAGPLEGRLAEQLERSIEPLQRSVTSLRWLLVGSVCVNLILCGFAVYISRR